MLTVGCVLRETLSVTLHFVAWYLREGADRILLCFDDPADPAIAVLKDHPQVQCVPCTEDFWLSIGINPAVRFARRQNLVMSHFYKQQGDGWFFYVDGDELLHLQGRTLAQELDATPGAVRAVTFLPAENIQSPELEGADQFRLVMSREAVRRIYGDQAGLMQKRQGLSGHTVGKTANRAGQAGLVMRQHFMQHPDGTVVMDRVLGPEEGAYLLHFFDQGFDIWRAKLPWRLASSGFPGRIKTVLTEILEGNDPEPALRALYDQIHVFDNARLATLSECGARFALRLDREALIAAHFPAVSEVLEATVRYAADDQP
ncbi:glycosyltransferase family 2 protein [Sulfitobacter sp. JB4-11]|uniref:glycosyltransferase family 2 protein n=1 Tax=Sulfitobacter rhodophyticola TaxID=3238304 RepID=UPI0035156F1F